MNASNLIMGRTDDTLSEEGKKQAKSAAEKIAAFPQEDLPQIIICSPLKRAKETAAYVAEALEEKDGIKINVQYDRRLIEQDYGQMEGTSRLSEAFAQSKREFAMPTGKTGESHFQLAQRSYNILDEIIEKYRDKKVLLVTHGGICRVIASYFKPMTNEEYAEWRAQNCQLDLYEI